MKKLLVLLLACLAFTSCDMFAPKTYDITVRNVAYGVKDAYFDGQVIPSSGERVINVEEGKKTLTWKTYSDFIYHSEETHVMDIDVNKNKKFEIAGSYAREYW